MRETFIVEKSEKRQLGNNKKLQLGSGPLPRLVSLFSLG